MLYKAELKKYKNLNILTLGNISTGNLIFFTKKDLLLIELAPETITSDINIHGIYA